jgi:hypothetical protein
MGEVFWAVWDQDLLLKADGCDGVGRENAFSSNITRHPGALGFVGGSSNMFEQWHMEGYHLRWCGIYTAEYTPLDLALARFQSISWP